MNKQCDPDYQEVLPRNLSAQQRSDKWIDLFGFGSQEHC